MSKGQAHAWHVLQTITVRSLAPSAPQRRVTERIAQQLIPPLQAASLRHYGHLFQWTHCSKTFRACGWAQQRHAVEHKLGQGAVQDIGIDRLLI
jgi:hypothetical protein